MGSFRLPEFLYKGVRRGYKRLQQATVGLKGLQGVKVGYKGLQGITGEYKGLQRVIDKPSPN